MKNILWLASWFPDKILPFAGDFIERHAKAASLHNSITVLYVVKDERNVSPGKFFIERRRYHANCSAVILYYKPFSEIFAIEKAIAPLRFFIFFAELIRDHIQENGKPDLIHVHVSWRAGLLALYCKWRYSLTYAVSEHWSAFLPNASDGFSSLPFPVKWMLKRIFGRAKKVSAVSEELSAALQKLFTIHQPFIIPNVVDTQLFAPTEKNGEVFRFVHISELTETKNIKAIFEALQILVKRTPQPVELVLFSPIEASFIQMATSMDIRRYVRFEGYVPHEVLARELAGTHCLVLYSSYETFGCVVIEANACGLPVIVSDIPVMHELVEDNITGVFVPLGAPGMLAEKMLWMMQHHTGFDSKLIVSITKKKFGMETIAGKFDDFYRI